MANIDTTTRDMQEHRSYDLTVSAAESLGPRIAGTLGRHKLLFGGLLLVIAVILFAVAGTLVIDEKRVQWNYADAAENRPSKDFLLGTDQKGRDILAYVAYGTMGTLWIGLIAGVIGIAIGTVLGLLAGYFGGVIDTVAAMLSDALITIPGLMLLITLSAYLDNLTVNQLGILIGAISWMGATRVVRAQVLKLKNRAYVEVSRFNGQGDMEIVLTELIPNLAPFIAVAFIPAVVGAIHLSIGLSILSLGPHNEPSLGLMVWEIFYYGAVPQGLWWWFGPPIVVIAIFVVGLFMITAGLDQIANPRLRTSV